MRSGIRVLRRLAREENVGDTDRDRYDKSSRGIRRTCFLGLCNPPDAKLLTGMQP